MARKRNYDLGGSGFGAGISGFSGGVTPAEEEPIEDDSTEDDTIDDEPKIHVRGGGTFDADDDEEDAPKGHNVLIKTPELCIEPHALHKLFLFADMHPEELSGTGVVAVVEIEKDEKDKISRVIIKEAFAVESFNNAVHTDATQGLQDYFQARVEKGVDTSNLKLWFHSHHSMGPFWSGEDHGTAYNFDNEDFMVSIVVGTGQRYRARIDVYSPLRITIDNVPLKLYLEKDSEIGLEVAAEIKKFVKPDTFIARGKKAFKDAVGRKSAAPPDKDDKDPGLTPDGFRKP